MPAKNKTKRWSMEEELDLAASCNTMSVTQLAKKLKRSYASVQWKLTELHLNKKAREADYATKKVLSTPSRKYLLQRIAERLGF